MATNLNFAVVANNAVTLEFSILDANGNGIDGTGLSIKWEWFIAGMPVVKTTAGGGILIKTVNPLVFQIPILPSDTLGAVQGYYAHEAITVDGSGNPITITNNDSTLSNGLGYVRSQLTVQ